MDVAEPQNTRPNRQPRGAVSRAGRWRRVPLLVAQLVAVADDLVDVLLVGLDGVGKTVLEGHADPAGRVDKGPVLHRDPAQEAALAVEDVGLLGTAVAVDVVDKARRQLEARK